MSAGDSVGNFVAAIGGMKGPIEIESGVGYRGHSPWSMYGRTRKILKITPRLNGYAMSPRDLWSLSYTVMNGEVLW
jgi:hypothetical protein